MFAQYRTKKKTGRSKSSRSLEDKLWRVFSEYIRLRDTNDLGYGPCCSCGRMLHWKDGDAGHFVGRRHKSLKFNERNVHLQCRSCNRFNAGEQYVYGKFLDRKYGPGTAEMLVALAKTSVRTADVVYALLIDDYKKRVAHLKEKKRA